MEKIRQLDKFYTKKEIAKYCIDLIPNLEQYDFCIEPSAGNGSFSSQLNNCEAYDIEPEDKSIIKANWFDIEKKEGRFIVIGNPPFGKRNVLSKNFIKHSIDIGAETIAFILPEVFSKLSNQPKTVFPEEWRLIVEEKLPRNSFTIENKDFSIPCCFYIWTKEKGVLNLRQKKIEKTEDFVFLKRGDLNADFSINGNSGKIKNINEITNPKSEHYIKAKNKTIEELKEIFSNCNFVFLSSVNGGNAWIGQQEILKAYYDKIKYFN